jgi:hypothetical protein
MEARLTHYTIKSIQIWGGWGQKENESETEFYNRVIKETKENLKNTSMIKTNSFVEFYKNDKTVKIINIKDI